MATEALEFKTLNACTNRAEYLSQNTPFEESVTVVSSAAFAALAVISTLMTSGFISSVIFVFSLGFFGLEQISKITHFVAGDKMDGDGNYKEQGRVEIVKDLWANTHIALSGTLEGIGFDRLGTKTRAHLDHDQTTRIMVGIAFSAFSYMATMRMLGLSGTLFFAGMISGYGTPVLRWVANRFRSEESRIPSSPNSTKVGESLKGVRDSLGGGAGGVFSVFTNLLSASNLD